ncbi:MAG: hypothetical protein IJO91_08165 [Oscillospiraceae bacterium]|nr:hypothetical protein [Oscillospiraceae bacterium]
MAKKEKVQKTRKTAEERRKPITHDKIYKIMLWVTFIVAGAFFLINVFKMNVPGIIAVGGAILLFAAVVFVMKKVRIRSYTKEFVVSIGLEFIIFAISLFSGESYSDDFPMFLAVIGMSGMYMEPKYTRTQIVIADVLLGIMYLVDSKKGGPLGQYILCVVIFTLAAILFFLAIKRGRAFIDMSGQQTLQTQNLLWKVQEMGEDLEKDFNESSARIADSTKQLEAGSVSVIEGAGSVADRCKDVHQKIRVTGTQIVQLNKHVKTFEEALGENGENMEAMTSQLQHVNELIERTSTAVSDMKQQMNEVAAIAEQLNEISFKTTLLSLNAAVEASHAGAAGAGFAVVATEMKELSENSERFSDRVAEVVSHLLAQVERISEQFGGTTAAIDRSAGTMTELQGSFSALTQQFESLYDNINEQTRSVEAVDEIFEQLKTEVADMKLSSAENKTTVEDIVKAMDDYRENIGKVIVNTRVRDQL